LEEKIQAIDEQISAVFEASEPCRRIAAVEGIGPLIATALVAAICDGKTFKNGRQFAAWLGLVPRQHSSGGKTQLLGISKTLRFLSANSLDPWRALGGIPRQPKNRSPQSLDR